MSFLPARRRFVPRHFQNRVHRFLLGRIDETSRCSPPAFPRLRWTRSSPRPRGAASPSSPRCPQGSWGSRGSQTPPSAFAGLRVRQVQSRRSKWGQPRRLLIRGKANFASLNHSNGLAQGVRQIGRHARLILQVADFTRLIPQKHAARALSSRAAACLFRYVAQIRAVHGHFRSHVCNAGTVVVENLFTIITVGGLHQLV